MGSGPPEREAIVSGIGQSEFGRRLYRDPLELTLDSCVDAIKDAGLSREDIDGLTAYPGGMGLPTGFAGPGLAEVQDALRLDVDFHRSGVEGAAQMSAIIDAVQTVATDRCDHVLVYRTVTEATEDDKGEGSYSSPGGGDGGGGQRVGSWRSWLIPYGGYSAANWTALYCRRYMHEYGLTREQLAQIPINHRKNAALNPKATYREEMTLEDYLDVRMVSEPLCLYDCDVPIDGSTAFVISTRDYAADAPNPAVQFEAIGSARHGRPLWDQQADMTTMPGRGAGAQMWSRTDLRPSDVDTAQLYDGFSWLNIMWLEALDFCDPGTAGEFVESGDRIARGGELPLNTSGGQLSEGRMHGFGLFHEAVLQLRRQAGDRQVPDDPEVAAVANGGGEFAGCSLLSRVE